MGLPEARLFALQAVLNASARQPRLIARIPRFSHISSSMRQQLHWLPLTARIELKVAFVVLKYQLGSEILATFTLFGTIPEMPG